MCRKNKRWYIETVGGKFVVTNMEGDEIRFSDVGFALEPLLFSSLAKARKTAKKCGGIVRFYVEPKQSAKTELPL